MRRLIPVLLIACIPALMAATGDTETVIGKTDTGISTVLGKTGSGIATVMGKNYTDGDGLPSGTPLLGMASDLSESPDNGTANADTGYAFCDTGQATATATTAYIYSRQDGGGPVHVCVWNSSGTLLATSAAIALTGGAGWKSGSISVSITADTAYLIGIVGDNSVYTRLDLSSPSHPDPTTTSMTYGSEGNLSSATCNQSYGNWAVYITN